MALIVPVLAWILCFLIQARGGEWRKAFLSGSIIWGLMLVAITECLSLLNSFTAGWVLGLWGAIDLALLLFLVRLSVSNHPSGGWLPLPRPRLSVFLRLLCLGVVVVVILVGSIALIAPPNNWDSMTYHMGRVAHWIQNQSVSFYPTHILPQLHHGPWAEFTIAHLQILSGSDRFANLVQWFSMIGAVIGVTLIAQELGADRRGQVFAAVFCATIPMGILQASTTQNDYVVGFWLVCFVYWVLLFRRVPYPNQALGVGASLGLAILTKATAYIYALPFLVWFVLSAVHNHHWRSWKTLVLAATLASLVNVAHWSRNIDLYGSPLGPGQESPQHRYANDEFSARVLASNVVKNITLHLGTPSDQVNAFLENGVQRIHAWMGMDVNDLRTQWLGREFQVKKPKLHEDKAGNPLHLLLVVVALGIGLVERRSGLPRDRIKYSGCLVLAFLVFCFIVKWQLWHSRLHLPLFLLSTPWLGAVFGALKTQKLANSIALVFLLASLPWVLFNEVRPLVGEENIFSTSRTSQYFASRPDLEEPYTVAARRVNDQDCKDVGLWLRGLDIWEYPLWVLLDSDQNRSVKIEHVDVTNVSEAKYGPAHPSTAGQCAIICVYCSEDRQLAYTREFESVSKYGPVYVFTRQQDASWLAGGTLTDDDRGLAQSYAERGQQQLDQGAWQEASVYYRLAVVHWPLWGSAHTKLGNAYRHLDRLEEAEASYRRSIEVEPGYAGAYVNLGGLYEEQGRGQEALELLQAAVDIAPDSAWAHSALGDARLRLGDSEEALAHLARAVELEPDSVAWLLALANGYREVARYSETVAAYRRVLELDPGNRQAAQALESLEP